MDTIVEQLILDPLVSLYITLIAIINAREGPMGRVTEKVHSLVQKKAGLAIY